MEDNGLKLNKLQKKVGMVAAMYMAACAGTDLYAGYSHPEKDKRRRYDTENERAMNWPSKPKYKFMEQFKRFIKLTFDY